MAKYAAETVMFKRKVRKNMLPDGPIAQVPDLP